MDVRRQEQLGAPRRPGRPHRFRDHRSRHDAVLGGGYSGQFAVLSGQTATIPQTGATIALQRFSYRIDPIATKAAVYQPIDYVSDARVTGRDGITRDAVIRVNHPYDVDGTLVYQSTYGFAIDLRLTKDGRPVPGAPDQPIKEGEGFAIDGTAARSSTAFVGTIDRAPAASAPIRGRTTRRRHTGVRGRPPDRRVAHPARAEARPRCGIRAQPARYTLDSGVSVPVRPRHPARRARRVVLLAGLCISFYFLPARCTCSSAASTARSEVGLAATTVKGYDVFETGSVRSSRRSRSSVTLAGTAGASMDPTRPNGSIDAARDRHRACTSSPRWRCWRTSCSACRPARGRHAAGDRGLCGAVR